MLARGVIATVALIAAWFAAHLDSASAQDGGWTSDFYSYLPAAPDIKTPDLDFIPFWTDDLKKAKRAYKEGDFAKARKYFERASDDNNIVADWYLGHMAASTTTLRVCASLPGWSAAMPPLTA